MGPDEKRHVKPYIPFSFVMLFYCCRQQIYTNMKILCNNFLSLFKTESYGLLWNIPATGNCNSYSGQELHSLHMTTFVTDVNTKTGVKFIWLP